MAANVKMPSDFPRHHRSNSPDRAEVLMVVLVTIASVVVCGWIAACRDHGWRERKGGRATAADRVRHGQADASQASRSASIASLAFVVRERGAGCPVLKRGQVDPAQAGQPCDVTELVGEGRVEEWRVVTGDRHVHAGPPERRDRMCLQRREQPGADVRRRADVEYDLVADEPIQQHRIMNGGDAVADPVGFEDVEALGDARWWAHLAGMDLEAESQPSCLGPEVDELGRRDGPFSTGQTQADDRSGGRLDDAQRRLGLGPPEAIP
jgi:hypothetical protein